ncbi:hypothetical protein [Shewanella chilikensis]|uniref:hypothetical protein n=1 Tax=Shewanella chilikensis TaxID=558541 RepID=UPI00399A943F
MTRKKKVIIGLIAFVAFNAYVYKGAHYVPVGKMLELSEECRLLVGPSSRQYPSSKYYIASEDEFEKELDKLNIIAQTSYQCRQFTPGSHDDTECIFATYWESSTASASEKTTTIDAMKIFGARHGMGMKEHSERCFKQIRDISASNDRRLKSEAYARKEGYGWRNVFPALHWYYEVFLKW